MNIKVIKTYLSMVLLIVALAFFIVFLFNSVIESTKSLIHGDDYLDFDPKQFVVLFGLPVGILAEIFFIVLLFPIRKKIIPLAERLMVPVAIYGVVSIALGMLLSLGVLIYPLSTHYYKCNSTSVISSGSYYARTKEMCKERARLRAEGREKKKTESGVH